MDNHLWCRSFSFALPAIFYNWQILFFIAAMFPFVLVSIYYTKKKDERNLLNDLAGIAILPLQVWDPIIFLTALLTKKSGGYPLYPSLFLLAPRFTSNQ